MRASSHGPFRTMMMIFPLLAVAGLAYLGGYHYHTLAASQTASPSAEDDLGEDIVVLGDQADATPQLGVDELFLDNHSSPAENIHAAPPARHERNPDITVVAEQPRRETARPRPQSRRDNRRPRRYPSAAMDGWQFADDSESAAGDGTPAIAETTATQPNEIAAEFDETLDQPPAVDSRDSRLQAAIDARRSNGGDSARRDSTDQLASVWPADDLRDASEYRPRSTPRRDLEAADDKAAAYVEEAARSVPPTREIEEAPVAARPEYRDPRSFKEATQILRDWGIRKFKLETTADGGAFRFLCGVTDLHNPSIRRLFVAEGDEPLVAVRNALRQIEDWRAQQ